MNNYTILNMHLGTFQVTSIFWLHIKIQRARMREEVWDIAKKNLAYEDHIKKENRQMKPAWLLLLKEAIDYEKTRAIRFDTNIDYRAAILISLSRTGRLITPERLAGLEIYTDKDMENEQTLDDIWERANLELDYQMITAKKGTRGICWIVTFTGLSNNDHFCCCSTDMLE